MYFIVIDTVATCNRGIMLSLKLNFNMFRGSVKCNSVMKRSHMAEHTHPWPMHLFETTLAVIIIVLLEHGEVGCLSILIQLRLIALIMLIVDYAVGFFVHVLYTV